MNSQRTVSSITDVKDSKGNPVDNGESTDDPLLTVYGGGTASSVVFVYDNGDLLTTASVTINHTWDFTDTFELGRHVFTVRDSLAGVDSPPWIVTVGEVAVKPEITTVTDSKGEVAPDGTTFDTTVTLSGIAAANEVVELFQDGALLGDVPVNASSIWTRPVTGLTENRHNFQVRGRYGNNPVSGIRSLTVVASAVPTIDSIKDAAGVEIPPNTTTFSTSVTLTGKAAAGEQVQVFDGTSSLGTVTATGTTWTLALTGLALKDYNIKAKGLYGSNPESAVRVFKVAVATVPTIDSIKDAAGVEIPPNTTTFSTSVTLTGKAAAGQQVQILDGGTVLGTVTATGGNWTLALPSLAIKAYNIKAKGLYGSNPESAVRVFTVAVATVPNIDSIKDAAGVEIPPNTTTFSTSVTLTGKAAAGQQVQILDGGTVLGTVTATGGNWTLALPSLAIKAYNIKAKGLYGSNPESAVRVFTVAVATVPNIDSIKDAAGVEIPPNTTTFSTSVTLTGKAAAGEQVQVFDGTSSLGTVTATGTTWTLALTGLALKAYNIKAKGLYGSNPESAVRVFTVAVATVPTIDSIKDAAGVEIPPNTTTFSTRVTLTGKAAAGQQVQILDGGTVLGTVTATGGNWTLALPSLAIKAYNIKAKGLYGSNPESAVRVFTVAVATVPNIDSIKDAAGVEIPPNTTTFSTSVTLTGKAAADQRVEILDDGESKGEVTVDGNGDWTYTLQGLTAKGYIITARGRYANNPVSQRRTFSVVTVAVGREDFEGYQGPETLPSGVNISFANGLVCLMTPIAGVLQPTISPRSIPYPPWGLKSLQVFSGNDPRFEFGGLIRTFKFTYHTNVANDSVTFYAADDTEIQSYPLIIFTETTVELTLSRPCAYCKFRLNRDFGDIASSSLDNFEWS